MSSCVDDIFEGLGVEITLKTSEDFLKVKETLTRIGVDLDILYRNELKDVAVKEKQIPKTLYQSCHILHKRGRYAILHFKELFALDGKHSDITDVDLARRNTIVKLLSEWNMIDVVNKESFFTVSDFAEMNQMKIISHKAKHDWELITKYTIGSNKEK